MLMFEMYEMIDPFVSLHVVMTPPSVLVTRQYIILDSFIVKHRIDILILNMNCMKHINQNIIIHYLQNYA